MTRGLTFTLTASLLVLAGGLQSCSAGQEHGGGDWIEDDFAAASAASEESGRPILLDLYADWCGPCRTLASEYFTAPEMQEVLGGFVLAKADVDGAEGGRLAQVYGVSAIPCVVITTADGTEIDRIVGLLPTPADYAAALGEILAGI